MNSSLNFNRIINGAVTALPSGVTVELHLPARGRITTRGRSFAFANGRWLERIVHPDTVAPSNRSVHDEWVFVVRNALVTSDHVIYTEDGTRLEPSAGWVFGRDTHVDLDSLRQNATAIDERVAFAGTRQGRIGDRWLLQVMPCAVRLRQLFGDVPVIVPPARKVFEGHWGTAGIPPEKLIVHPKAAESGAVSAIRVRELLVTNQLALPSEMSGDRFDQVLRQFDNITPVPGSPERLFLMRSPRKGGKRGGMANVQEISELAARLGFAVVMWDDYSLHDLIALIAGAKIVIGEGGVNLYPTVFAPPGSVVVEISQPPRDAKRGLQHAIGAYRGHNVGSIYCDGDQVEWKANPEVVGAALGKILETVL